MNGKVLKSHPKNTRLQLISPTTVSFKQLKREGEREKKKNHGCQLYSSLYFIVVMNYEIQNQSF